MLSLRAHVVRWFNRLLVAGEGASGIVSWAGVFVADARRL